MDKIKTIFLIILTITLAACTSNNGDDTPITDIDVYRGTDGLEIEIFDGSPPLDVYEGETFQVVAQLTNKGAYPIHDGILVLTYEEDYVEPIGAPVEGFELKGKEIYDPSDHNTIKSFFLTAKNIGSLSNTHPSIILVTACHDYMTKLSTEVCIDTDPHNLKTIENLCELDTLSFSGQGGPVTVSRIEQKMLVDSNGGVRPQFKIYIENKGRGEVVSSGKIGDVCSSETLNRTDINGIILKNISFSRYSMKNNQIECIPKNLRLIDGEDHFICSLRESLSISSDRSPFITGLYLEFDYGYTLTKSREFEIKKSRK
ncbi:hypothetical protein GOV08_02365 [Candidatus Woesearchaeota archaeon]|nr:hypothetical protein [Candidatus Woesearchaeota archaeon]